MTCVGSASTSIPSKKVIMIGSRSNAGFAICNPEGRAKRPRGHRRVPVFGVLMAVIFTLIPMRAWCADPSWQVLIEPKFMKREVTFEIPKSERAALAPALMKNGDPVCLSQKEFKALGVDWKAF